MRLANSTGEKEGSGNLVGGGKKREGEQGSGSSRHRRRVHTVPGLALLWRDTSSQQRLELVQVDGQRPTRRRAWRPGDSTDWATCCASWVWRDEQVQRGPDPVSVAAGEDTVTGDGRAQKRWVWYGKSCGNLGPPERPWDFLAKATKTKKMGNGYRRVTDESRPRHTACGDQGPGEGEMGE